MAMNKGSVIQAVLPRAAPQWSPWRYGCWDWREGSAAQNLLLLWGTRVWFPTPTLEDSQPTTVPTSWGLNAPFWPLQVTTCVYLCVLAQSLICRLMSVRSPSLSKPQASYLFILFVCLFSFLSDEIWSRWLLVWIGENASNIPVQVPTEPKVWGQACLYLSLAHANR